MKGLSLVHHILQGHCIGHKFVVDDGLFQISRIIGPEMAASTESEVLGELVMPFDLGRSLVNGAAQRFVHDPFQQVRCPYRVSKFLQGQGESIFGAVAVDLRQNRGGCERSALDCQRELQELRVVLMDQRPVDRARKQ